MFDELVCTPVAMAMNIAGGLTEKGVVIGNAYDKYGSNNPIVRWLMCEFERELQSLVKSSGESSLHEIGCGEGYWTIKWARQGLTVRGSDFSEIAISLARENAAVQGVSVPFSVKSIYDLDPATDGAPLLVCCEVLEHLENPRMGAGEASVDSPAISHCQRAARASLGNP